MKVLLIVCIVLVICFIGFCGWAGYECSRPMTAEEMEEQA